MSRTLDGRFLESLARAPERTFLRHLGPRGEARISYDEEARRTAATVESLRAAGLRPGDRLVCYLDELVPSVHLFLAAAHAGIWPVPIAPGFSAEAVQSLVEQVEAAAVFTTAELAPRLTARGMRPLGFVADGAAAGDLRPLDHRIDLPSARARAILAAAEAGHTGDDVYMLQPTSGTTGRFKLVMLPHRHQCYVADLLAFGMRASDEPQRRLLLVAALTHGMGQIVFAVALTVGGELAVPSRLDTAAPLEELRALDSHYLTMTPRVLRSLQRQQVEQGGAGRLFGPSAEMLVVGGSASDLDLLREVNDQGVDVIECFGASEFGFAAAGPRGAWRPGLVGKVVPDVKLKFDDDGELLVWSPEHMVGYYGDEPATRAAFTDDGYYRTGDFCELTDDGYVRYAGRKKDVFNTHEGTNVHPGRIEAAIDALSWVRQVVLIGDQRPYLSALIVIHDPPAPVSDSDGDGLLDEAQNAALYARARADLQRLNRELEPIERVRRFALLARPLASELYALVGHSKVRRDRRAIASAYAARIEALYQPPTAPSSGGAVPDEG